jgi:hypothetical protein
MTIMTGSNIEMVRIPGKRSIRDARLMTSTGECLSGQLA